MNGPDDRFIAENTFYVRYAETDAQGVVHHASYIVYFEEGRSHYARVRGHDYASIERGGVLLVVTEVNARYLKPMVYGQLITCRCWIDDLRSRQVTFAYEIIDSQTRAAHVTGSTRHMCVTRDGRLTTIPDAWRAWTGT
jgi:acyl-CoA thioester hydrolase